MDQPGVAGPIDFLLLEFDPTKTDGSAAAALADLVDRGIVALYDFLVIAKAEDGTVAAIDISADGYGGFNVFAGARSGLVGPDDITEAGAALEPGRAAALFVYENTWAIPFIAAARAADAEVVASARIPAEVVIATLDALDAADAAN
jgi:hypothetical protein